MNKTICLLIVIACLSAINSKQKYQKKEIKDMTSIEKDKYLACDKIVKKRLVEDKPKIDEVLKDKKGFLAKGLERTIELEMLLDCVEKIPDADANKLIKDLQPVATEFDLKDYDYKFDYEPYRKKHEFIFERHLVDAMNNVKDLIKESKGEKVEERKEGDKPDGKAKEMPKGTGKSAKDLAPIEKDKYLACNAITITKLKEDKEKIDEVLKDKEDFLAKGLRKCITLEMIIKCVKEIKPEKAQILYKDLVTQTEDVDLTKNNFEFDYAPFKEKNEFIYEPYLIDTMNILREIVQEYGKKRREMRAKEGDKGEPKARSAWAKVEKKDNQPEYKKTSDL